MKLQETRPLLLGFPQPAEGMVQSLVTGFVGSLAEFAPLVVAVPPCLAAGTVLSVKSNLQYRFVQR